MSFFRELQRRNVVKVAIAYVVVCWLLLQVSDVLVPALHLPEWIQTATAYFLMIGFLPALLFAWAFELTPDGIRRESEVAPGESVTDKTSQKLNVVIIAVLLVTVAFLLSEKFFFKTAGTETLVTQDVAAEPLDTRKAIAVLPFENLSANQENEYFAAGVHEDILTYLSRIAELRVNSRTSVQQYAKTQLNLKDVAVALGATFVVEGSVRRAGNRVRVTAQLIDATTDEHLWAENFDRELTDIFEIQTAVAQEIVTALHAELSSQEVAMINARPTESIEAYDLFLQARQALTVNKSRGIYSQEALDLLEEAVRIDPGFAQAWALLAMTHGDYYWFRTDTAPDRLEKMKQAVDRAFELRPGMPEARMALAAYYYRGFYDYPKALEQLLLAKEQIPNDALLHFDLGLTYRRLGDYDQSIASFREATQLDPANQQAWAEGLLTAQSSGRVEETVEFSEQIKVRFGSLPRMLAERAMARLSLFGDIKGAQDLMAGVGESDSFYVAEARYTIALYGREFSKAAVLAQDDAYMEELSLGAGLALSAIVLHLGDQDELADEVGRKAIAVLAQEVTKPYAQNYAGPHASYAAILSLRGEHQQARTSCERAKQILPLEKDKVHGVSYAKACLIVQARSGDIEGALDQLEILKDIGWDMSPWMFALNPEWDFMRGHPRFDALAAR